MPSGNPNMGTNKNTGTAGKPGSNSGKDAGSKSGAGGPGGAGGVRGGNSGPKSSGGASKSTGPAANRQSASAASGKSASNSGGRGPAASMAAGASSKRDQSGTGIGGMLSGSRGPSPASRQGAAQAASANRSGGILGGGGPSAASRAGHAQAVTGSLHQGLLGRGGMVPTPETHPFRDPSRFSYGPFSNVTPDTLSKGLHNLGMLSQLANAQTQFGKPLQINAGYAETGHKAKGAHPKGMAFDVQVPNTYDRPGFIEAATRAGFTHTGTYGPGLRGVHVDVRPGTGTWGSTTHAASTPGWHSDAVAAGKAAGPLNMASIAAQTRSPSFGAPSLSSAVVGASGTGLPSSFPGRPGLPGAMGFPAEDRQPSTFPGRPEPGQQFNSQIAGRPAPQPQFNSMMAARPEKTGLGFPAAFRSDFPGRPAPQAGFASQIAGRPDPQQNFMSQMAGKPDFPGALPGAQVTDNFPGRPQMPQGFQSQMAGRPGLPQSFNSQIAARPGTVGSGFPAAQHLASAFPGRPETVGHGFPQAQTPQTAQQGGSWLDGIKNAVTTTTDTLEGAPGKIRDALINTIKGNPNAPGAAQLGGWSHPNSPQNPMGDQHGAGPDGSWTGQEPPQAVAQMQQHVEQILASYFATPQTQFPGYSSGQWAGLPTGSAA